MRNLVNEMAQAFKVKAYYPALITCITLPDICAAMSDINGKTNKYKYTKWFNKYAARHFGVRFDDNDKLLKGECIQLDGETAYLIRNSVLHQGRLVSDGNKEIMFVIENNGINLNLIGIKSKMGKDFLVLELGEFCKAIGRAVLTWLKEVEGSELYKNNYKMFFKRDKQWMPWEENITIIAAI